MRGGMPRGKGRGKATETLGQLVKRAEEFLTVRHLPLIASNSYLCTPFQIGRLRTKEDSIENLKAIYRSAATVGGITRAKKLKTLHGLRDKYQDFYVEKISHFLQSLSGDSGYQKQLKVDEFVNHFPRYPMNPIYRIKGERDAL